MAVDFNSLVSRHLSCVAFVAAVIVVILLIACAPRFTGPHTIRLMDIDLFALGFLTCVFHVVRQLVANFARFAEYRRLAPGAVPFAYGPLFDFWTANMSAKRRGDSKNIIAIAVESL
jgi:hypothetical protein